MSAPPPAVSLSKQKQSRYPGVSSTCTDPRTSAEPTSCQAMATGEPGSLYSHMHTQPRIQTGASWPIGDRHLNHRGSGRAGAEEGRQIQPARGGQHSLQEEPGRVCMSQQGGRAPSWGLRGEPEGGEAVAGSRGTPCAALLLDGGGLMFSKCFNRSGDLIRILENFHG